MRGLCSCERTVECLLDFVDGALAPSDELAIGDHLIGCAGCRDLVASYQKTAALCRQTLRRAAPDDFADRLMIYLRTETAGDGQPDKRK